MTISKVRLALGKNSSQLHIGFNQGTQDIEVTNCTKQKEHRVSQLASKFTAFYGNQRLNTKFTRTRDPSILY
jgi:hypothetical protein